MYYWLTQYVIIMVVIIITYLSSSLTYFTKAWGITVWTTSWKPNITNATYTSITGYFTCDPGQLPPPCDNILVEQDYLQTNKTKKNLTASETIKIYKKETENDHQYSLPLWPSG